MMDVIHIKQFDILIIEDDYVMRTILENDLNSMRVKYGQCFYASSLKAGIDVFRKEHVDVVFLDLNLPDSSGLATVESFLKICTESAVVVITGEDSEEVGMSAINMGAQDYLVKGKYDLELLRKTIYFSYERKKLQRKQVKYERMLCQLKRLESLGRLAAGIAHEINTPLQFIQTNLQFVMKGITALSALREIYHDVEGQCIDAIARFEEQERVPFFVKELPAAVSQGIAGVEDIEKVVTALRFYTQVDSFVEKEALDLHKALDAVVTLSHSRWVKLADVEKEFDESLPQVQCCVADMNQVFMCVFMNAICAIEEKNKKDSSHKGTIRCRTEVRDGYAVVSISDNGVGIPLKVQDTLFEPCVTAGDCVRDVGYGLAIAYVLVVDKHNGKMTFETEVGEGTSFHVWLPLEG